LPQLPQLELLVWVSIHRPPHICLGARHWHEPLVQLVPLLQLALHRPQSFQLSTGNRSEVTGPSCRSTSPEASRPEASTVSRGSQMIS